MSASCIPARVEAPLVEDGEGIWHTGGPPETVSYPLEAHEMLRSVEQDSWWFAHRNRVILEAVRLFPPAGEIWDIGGGNGVVSAMLTERGFDSVLLEAGLEGCRNARRRGVNPVVHGTLASVRFKKGALPAAAAFDVLEHAEDPAAFLGGLREALRDGGRLYLTVPAHAWLWSDEDRWAGHVVRFSRSGLLSLLREERFSVLYLSFFFSWLGPAIYLRRVLPGRLRRTGRRPGRKLREELTRQAHRTPPGWLGAAWAKHLDREAGRIGRGRSVSHGASLLAVCAKSGDP